MIIITKISVFPLFYVCRSMSEKMAAACGNKNHKILLVHATLRRHLIPV